MKGKNNQDSLRESLNYLVQTVALVQLQLAETNKRMDDRVTRIEQAIATIIKMVEDLPEAVREKIGFKATK